MSEPTGSAAQPGQEPGLVSVVMPVRNESGAIEGALRAALAQTYADLEVLVVDGASTDDTREKVRAIAQRDPRVRLLGNPARAISPALNVGLAAARGAYLARMDGHATVNAEYVARGVAHLDADPRIAAVGGIRLGEARSATGRAIALALSSPFGVGDSINHYAQEVTRTDHASFGVYRTEVARAVGGWDEALIANEDVDIDFRILAAGHEILFDPAMEITWHVRESLRDLARQYRRYGRGKGAMVAKNGPSAVRVRHLAAPGLVAGLAVAGGLVVARRPLAAAALTAPYGAAVLAASAWEAARAGQDSEANLGVLPAAFVAMHVPWGVGFYEGLVLRRRPAAASQR